SISALEVGIERGEIGREEALVKANEAIAAITPAQGFVFRLGMILIPVITLTVSYVILRKKYHIDEEEYRRLTEKGSGTVRLQ
ncbi:MAG: hypothetical protein IKS07_09495, partial [Lachnospiraceae bacterium]|nr:hypothetical protein [Lachnospiraceae bacterium]